MRGERCATRLSAIRVSIDRRSFSGASGSILPDDFLQCHSERFRSKAGADDNKKAVVGAQGVRIVDRSLGRLVS